MTRLPPRRDRGTVYLLVLVTISLVTLLALSGITAARIQGRTARSDEDALRAAALAHSAIDLAIHKTSVDAEWRKSAAALVSSVALNGGTLKVDGSDPLDADFLDSADDPVLIRATATVGNARRIYEAFLDPEFDPLRCLDDALVVGGKATFSNCTVSAETIHIGGKSAATAAMIAGHVRAADTISGSSYLWTKKVTATLPVLPALADFKWYEDNGTPISHASLPSGEITRCVLSPASNPFNATTDPRGLYVINCGGQDVNIRDCRIVGTLVLLNPGSGSRIEGSVLWEPAVAGFPALLIAGFLELNLSTTALSESSLNVNFNPTGTPFGGADDSDKADTYSPTITGPIYALGNAKATAAGTLSAALFVGGNLEVLGPLTCAPSWTSISSPPPAFRAGSRMLIRHGSIVQVVD